MASGIYEIVSPSGKRYIGSAVNLARRWNVHIRELREGRHHNPGLMSAFAKYGESGLSFSVVEHCARELLLAREQFHIDAHQPSQLYNSCLIAGSRVGVPNSAEARKKISHSLRKHYTDESARDAQRAKAIANWSDIGIRDKIISRLKGRERSLAHCAALSMAMTGKTATAETRAKMSKRKLGKQLSPEVYAQQAATRTGRRKGGISGYCGVYRENAKWRVKIVHKGVKRDIGLYLTPTLAYAMRLVYLAALPPEGI